MSDDLISRQAAIETLLKGKIDEDESLVECPEECNAMIDGAIEDIKALPSADVREVIHAHWEEADIYGNRRCSNCKSVEHVPTLMGKPIVWDFCPNCGADMRGEQK